MAVQLTPEILAALAAHPGAPAPLVDAEGVVVGYFVTTDELEDLRSLRHLLDEADQSEDVDATLAHERLRALASGLADDR